MSKRIEHIVPITGIDLTIAQHPGRCIDNPNRLRLSISYSAGGIKNMLMELADALNDLD